MTVKEIIDFLKDMPSDAIVTDEYDNEVLNIGYEPSEDNPNVIKVWFEVHI